MQGLRSPRCWVRKRSFANSLCSSLHLLSKVRMILQCSRVQIISNDRNVVCFVALHLIKKQNSDISFVFFSYILGVHYYINTDRYAWGGVIAVRSSLDNTPQVRGAEVFAVNAECTQVFYEEDGSWKPYRSARDIHCTHTDSWLLNRKL